MALTFLFKADGSQYTRGLEKMRGQTQKWSSSMSRTIAGAFAGGVVIAGIKKLIDAASDLNETISKSQVIFGRNSSEIEAWADTLATSFGISKTAGLEAASSFASMFQILGVGEDEAKGMSKELVELASDMASFNNTSIEDALASIGSGLRGEAEPLRKFNVLLNDATLRAQSLAMGLTDGKSALTLQEKALAAYNTILTQTEVAQGDFERTSDGLANSMRILSAESDNAAASMGQKVLPVMERVTNALKGASSTIADWVEGFTVGFSMLVAAATQALIEVSDVVSSIASAIASAAKGEFKQAVETVERMVAHNESAAERISKAWNEAGQDAVNSPVRPPSGAGGGAGGGGNDAAEKKALQARLDTAEKIKKAEEALNNAMRSRLSDEQKLIELQKKRASLVGELTKDAEKGSKEELANIKLKTRIAQVGNQAIAVNEKIKKDQEKVKKDEADIELDKRKIDNKLDDIFAEADREGPQTSVIASSLASIGGGGNVASFTSDPILAATIEANKLLLQIEKNTERTPAAPTTPEL